MFFLAQVRRVICRALTLAAGALRFIFILEGVLMGMRYIKGLVLCLCLVFAPNARAAGDSNQQPDKAKSAAPGSAKVHHKHKAAKGAKAAHHAKASIKAKSAPVAAAATKSTRIAQASSTHQVQKLASQMERPSQVRYQATKSPVMSMSPAGWMVNGLCVLFGGILAMSGFLVWWLRFRRYQKA